MYFRIRRFDSVKAFLVNLNIFNLKDKFVEFEIKFELKIEIELSIQSSRKRNFSIKSNFSRQSAQSALLIISKIRKVESKPLRNWSARPPINS